MLTDEDILSEFNGENLCEDPLEVDEVVDKEIKPPCVNDDGAIQVLQSFSFSTKEDEKRFTS